MEELSTENVIIIVVVCVILFLIMCSAVVLYFCCCRRPPSQESQRPRRRPRRDIEANGRGDRERSKRHSRGSRDSRNSAQISLNHLPSAAETRRLDHLPSAAETRRMDKGKDFFENSPPSTESGRGTTETEPEEQITNYIMGPSAEIAERSARPGIENDGFNVDNQIDGGAYLRGGVDPADVAEAYMKDEFLRDMTKSRRQEQLEVRRKIARSQNQKRQSRGSKR